jgi:hypothetical protein
MISLKVLWRNLFRRAEFERNLSDELASYADLLTDEKIGRGTDAGEARRQALVEIGGVEQVKEEVRDVRAGSSWDGVFKDVRQSVRSLWHSPGSTALAIGTLGIGLGATILIFSIFYGILLQPLPFRDPGRLVQLWETRTAKGWDQAGFSRPNFWDVRARSTAFESMGALLGSNMNLTGSGNPEHLSAGVVSAQFFHVLGVAPILGHDFGPLQDQPGHNHDVVLLSSRFWKSRFAGSRNVLGTKLRLDGRAYTVIGVLPKGEPWLNAADVFVPMVYDPKEDDRGNFGATVIGRLAPGVTISAARAELQSVAERLSETYPVDRGMGVRIAPSEIWPRTAPSPSAGSEPLSDYPAGAFGIAAAGISRRGARAADYRVGTRSDTGSRAQRHFARGGYSCEHLGACLWAGRDGSFGHYFGIDARDSVLVGQYRRRTPRERPHANSEPNAKSCAHGAGGRGSGTLDHPSGWREPDDAQLRQAALGRSRFCDSESRDRHGEHSAE